MMVEHTPQREGLEALESDIELYNLLIDKQREGDSLLSRFNIVLSAHYEDYDVEEANTIYVVRGKSDLAKTTNEAEWFNVHIQVVIQVSNDNSIVANQILRSTYRRIKKYVVKNPIWGFMSTTGKTPLYTKEGKVSEFVIDFTATEVEEFQLYNELEDEWKLLVIAEAGVDGTEELDKLFPPIEIKGKKVHQRHKEEQSTPHFDDIIHERKHTTKGRMFFE
ncbi:hypothetical protein [Methanosphaera sp.]